MVHANHSLPTDSSKVSKQFSGDSKASAATATSAGSASSSSSQANSFSGGPATGWVINITDGPVLYHTGDTNVLSDMGIVDSLYHPSHILMPIGKKCTLGPLDAAVAIRDHLESCHTIIPMLFDKPKNHDVNRLIRPKYSDNFADSSRSLLEAMTPAASALLPPEDGYPTQLHNELCR